MNRIPELFDLDGAHKPAARIRDYWKAKGRIVETRIEQVDKPRDKDRDGTIWAVRSDLTF